MNDILKRHTKRPAKTGAERQRTYRQRKTLRFLEVTDETYSRLQAVCKQKKLTIDRAVAEALTLLESDRKNALETEIMRLRSMIAGHANGYVPAMLAIQREAGAIRASGNDGRGYVYGAENEV